MLDELDPFLIYKRIGVPVTVKTAVKHLNGMCNLVPILNFAIFRVQFKQMEVC